MTISFWHGLQAGPVLDSFKKIVEEYNVDHSIHVKLTQFDQYGAPVQHAFQEEEKDQPALVLAPEFQTSLMAAALKEGRVPTHRQADSTRSIR